MTCNSLCTVRTAQVKLKLTSRVAGRGSIITDNVTIPSPLTEEGVGAEVGNGEASREGEDGEVRVPEGT